VLEWCYPTLVEGHRFRGGGIVCNQQVARRRPELGLKAIADMLSSFRLSACQTEAMNVRLVSKSSWRHGGRLMSDWVQVVDGKIRTASR
jgi:hypothetical protein